MREQIMITGGAGFIGSAVVRELINHTEHKIVNVDKLTYAGNLESLASISLRFDGGTIATVCCGRLLPDSRNDFTIYGTDGRITGRATIWESGALTPPGAS